MTFRTAVQQGICPNCGGFLQYDKISDVVYCISECGFRMSSDSFEEELEEAHRIEYEVPDEIDNLSKLNNL